jgi:hypothetical protein
VVASNRTAPGELQNRGRRLLQDIGNQALNKTCKSRPLIHNAHLGKILSFCKTLGIKITHLEKIFD